MTLTRQRKSQLIILAADILNRVLSDNVIREVGGSTGGQSFGPMTSEESRFVEELLDNTIVVTGRHPQTGDLHVNPRSPE